VSDLREILQTKNVAIPESYDTFKDIFRHFKGKQVGAIQGDDGPLLDRPDEFYASPSAETGLLQGDVLENVPATWIQKNKDGTLASFRSEPGLAMVISNECDCENRENNSSQSFIRLCPVIFQSELLTGFDAKKQADVRGKLERNYYTEYFWMPAAGKTLSKNQCNEPLVADLSHFFSISLTDLYSEMAAKTVTKQISLSQEGYFLFLIKMAWFMLRPATPDTLRKDLQPWAPE